MKVKSLIKSTILTARSSFSDFSSLFMGNVISLSITLLSYPIISRLYSTTEFGEFALIQSLFSILIPLLTLNYQESILLIHSERRVRILTKSLVLIAAVFAALLFIISVFINAAEIDISINTKYLMLIPLILGITAIGQIGSYFLLRHKKFKIIASMKVTERGLSQLSSILLALSNIKYNGLIIGMLLGQAASSGIASVQLKDSLKQKLSRISLFSIFRKYKNFPLYTLPGGLLERFSRNIPILILSAYATNALTGEYTMAYKILSLPELVIGITITQLFYQRVSDRYLKSLPIRSLLMKTWAFLALTGILPTLLIILFGNNIFSYALGDSWEQAGRIAQILCIMIFAMLISTPTSATFNVLGKQSIGLLFGMITLTTRCTTFIVGLKYFSFYTALTIFVTTEILIILIFNLVLLKSVNAWEKGLRQH